MEKKVLGLPACLLDFILISGIQDTYAKSTEGFRNSERMGMVVRSC